VTDNSVDVIQDVRHFSGTWALKDHEIQDKLLHRLVNANIYNV